MVKILAVIKLWGEMPKHGGHYVTQEKDFPNFNEETLTKFWREICQNYGALSEDGSVGYEIVVDSITFFEIAKWEYRNVHQTLLEQRRKEEKDLVEQKELAELERLKAKYGGK